MSDMYERLGNLLNNVLETGEIPQDDITKDQNPVNYKDNGENSDPFSFINEENFRKKYTTENKNNVGTIIKEEDLKCINMHKYTKLMHTPCIVSKSLDTLHIVSVDNLTLDELKKQYHQILRENHPDTTNKKGILFTPEELKNAFDIVKKYFFS